MRETSEIPDWLDDIANTLAPDVRLHPQDTYLPCSVDWYLKRVDLCFATSAIVLVNKPGVTEDKLVSQTYAGQSSGKSKDVTDFFLTIPSAKDRGGKLDTAEVYYYVRDLGNGLYDIVYCVFYAYNGSLTYSTGVSGGAHEGDWEHVTVRVGSDREVIGVYFAAHGNEGRWYTKPTAKPNVPEAGKYCLGSAGQLIVYSAKHSHAAYPAPGKQPRAWSLPDDVTADGGKVLVSRNCLKPIDGASPPEWLQYTGRWGAPGVIASGPPTPDFQKWWKDEVGSGPVTNAFKVGDRQQDWVSTPNHPALAADGERLYIAVRTDEHTVLTWQSSNLTSWTAEGKWYPLIGTDKIATDNAPALAFFQGKLYLAVNRSDEIRFYSCANPASSRPTWTHHWSLTEIDFVWEPTFAVWGDTLYLGVTPKSDPSLLHIYKVNETEGTLDGTVKLPVELACAAGLVVHEGTMFVFFRGENDALGMMHNTNLGKWSVQHVLPGKTISTPGAAVFRELIYAGARTSSDELDVYMSAEGEVWSPKQALSDGNTAWDGPALAVCGDKLCFAYKSAVPQDRWLYLGWVG